VQVHAELDTLVKNVLGVVGGVDIEELIGGHVLELVAEGGVDDTVADGLGNDLLSLAIILQAQLLLDVSK